jgi:hypothetical protein
VAKLDNVKPSTNFEDKTYGLGALKSKLDQYIYKALWNLYPGFADEARASGQVSPSENEDYIRSHSKGPSPLSKMTVNDFTPDEWSRVKNQGFSLEDILVMRGRNGKTR